MNFQDLFPSKSSALKEKKIPMSTREYPARKRVTAVATVVNGDFKKFDNEKSAYQLKKERGQRVFSQLVKPKDHGIIVATDGSAKTKSKVSGIGVFFPQSKLAEMSEGVSEKIGTTNQKAELDAVVLALEKIIEWKKKNPTSRLSLSNIVHIYSDSNYVIKSATMWYDGWEKNNWVTVEKKPVLYKETHIKIRKLSLKVGTVIWHYVPSHQSPPENNDDARDIWAWNNQADSLATSAADATLNEIKLEGKKKYKKYSDDSDSDSD